MSAELGRIEKPSVEGFGQGRKLYFVPLIYGGKDAPAEYRTIYHRYWEQVDRQVADLEAKLGKVSRVFHELVAAADEAGCAAVEELNTDSYHLIRPRLDSRARLEAVEEGDLLAEFIDWNRCLAVGLMSQRVVSSIYESLVAASRKRNEHIARRIDEALKSGDIGLLIMQEGHQLQLPADIEVFYVAPPALDEVRRWLRDHPPAEREAATESPPEQPHPEG